MLQLDFVYENISNRRILILYGLNQSWNIVLILKD